MNIIIKNCKNIFLNMNIVSKYAFKYGTVLVLTLYATAGFFYINSFFTENAYFSIQMYTDLMYSAKECIGAVYILPMIWETVSMARKH